jgi:hypothetical protein
MGQAVTTVQQVQVGIKMEDCKTELKILKGAEKEKLANLILEEMYKLYIREGTSSLHAAFFQRTPFEQRFFQEHYFGNWNWPGINSQE